METLENAGDVSSRNKKALHTAYNFKAFYLCPSCRYRSERFNRTIVIERSWSLKALETRDYRTNKDESRILGWIDEMGTYRWIDEEAASDLLSRIVVPGKTNRNAGYHPKKRVHRGPARRCTRRCQNASQ